MNTANTFTALSTATATAPTQGAFAIGHKVQVMHENIGKPAKVYTYEIVELIVVDGGQTYVRGRDLVNQDANGQFLEATFSALAMTRIA